MKIEDLDNYVLKITEKYMRYYYSSEAQILKNETKEYENLGFDKYRTMPKEELLEMYTKISNVDVNINETSNKKR